MRSEPNMHSSHNKKKWFMIFLCTIILSVLLFSFYSYVESLLDQADTEKRAAVLKANREAEKLRLNYILKMKAAYRIEEYKKLTAAILELQPKLDKILAKRIAKTIITECDFSHLDPALITGLIKVESNFNPFAESNQGALGLMQVRYSAWKEEPELLDNGISAKGALFWIDRNIKSGTNILQKYYMEADRDMVRALYRYNTGKTQLPKDTNRWDIHYVNKVLYHAYQVKTMLTEDNKRDPESNDQ